MSAWLPTLPKEHGSWAMWLAPALVGVAITGRGPQALFLGTALVLFLARYPLTLWARGTPLSVAQRGWLTTYLALGLALGLALLTRYERWLLQRLETLGVAAAEVFEPIQAYGVTPEEVERGDLAPFWLHILEKEAVPVNP